MDSSRQAWLIADLLLAAAAIFISLRFLNSRRLMQYTGLIFLTLALLVISANYVLPALHVVAQICLVVLLVGLPVFGQARFEQLFNRDMIAAQPVSTFVHPILLGIIALVGGALLVGLSNGPGFKTAELPQGVVVSAANLKEGVTANFGSQKRINVIVRAPRSTWASLDSDDFSATVDVKDLAEGTHEAVVSVVSKITDVQIIRAKPTRVTVTLEPLIRKTVVIVARFSGKAAEELVPDDPIFEPEKVEVTGPKSLVADINQATVQISLEGQTKKIEQKYQLIALNSGGDTIEDVTFSPTEVLAKVPLVKAGKLKTVGVRIKTTGQPATGYWVTDLVATPSTVLVTATADVLDKLVAIDTDAVSVSGLNKDADASVSLVFPTGVVAADSVGKIAIKIRIGETATTKTVIPTISYDGVDASLKVASISPTSISLIVSGTTSSLLNLNGSDVILKLNLSAYKSAGTYAVTIKNDFFTLKEGINLVSFLPSAINVTLEVK